MSGESTPEESARIEAALAGHPEDREVLAVLATAASRMSDEIPTDIDVESALASVKKRRSLEAGITDLGVERRHRDQVTASRKAGWRLPFPAIAAAAALVIAGGSWIALRDRQPVQVAIGQPRMLATGVGIRDSLTLSDGTQVVLGPLSSVTVSRGYGSDDREVVVRGDAWFHVIHDEARPFTVRAGGATIVDVGTTFAVRSDVATGVAVSVTEGAVSLRPANIPDAQGVVLNAGDQGLLENGGQVVARRGVVTEDAVAWMSGRLVFREAPIQEVIASVRRWYGIELQVDSSLMGRHITATFDGESADRVLEVLRLVLGAEIERRGDTAAVRPANRR